MMLTPIARFCVSPSGAEPAETNLLLFDGRPVGSVSGSRIEHQFALGADAWVLFTTYDVPFEETLEILLLSSDFRVLQRESLGEDYTPGILGEVELEPPDAIRFRFPSHQLWRLELSTRTRGRQARFALRKMQA